MVNYAVTDFRTSPGSASVVLSELETKLETIDDSKTIRYIDILPSGNSFVGVLIYDA